MREGDYYRELSDEAYRDIVRPQLVSLVFDVTQGEPDPYIAVACSEDDPDQIIGWVAWEPDSPRLLFLYVKSPFRRFGIATALLAETGLPDDFVYCLKPPRAHRFLRRWPSARYQPLTRR
jgi:GNAT superfamily N-acetyltransferase